MARICACCFLLGFGFAAASVQKPGECSSTLRYSWTRRSYQADHRRHCGGRQSVQHHSPQRQDDIDKARFTSPAMGNHETVKYLVVGGDYGYSHNLRVDESKGGREWRLRRCACSLRICVRTQHAHGLDLSIQSAWPRYQRVEHSSFQPVLIRTRSAE